MKEKYYSLNAILSKNATYNVIFGERSNGKSYAVLEYALKEFWAHRSQLAIVRRWSDDFIGKRGQMMFASLECNGKGENVISKITGGEYTNIYYFASKWYLCRYDEETGKRIQMETPLAFGFSITAQEHDKSTNYPNVKTILFDEFLTRQNYVNDEFVLFMNVISTIIRSRTDVKIFMLGNTVNRYSPYFQELGLKHVKDMKQGTIDVYTYGDSRLTVAVEYVKPNAKGKENDYYFAFDNPKLQMITGGAWEIEIYPHCPMKYEHKHIQFEYFVIFNGDVLHAEIIQKDQCLFTFIHRKTTPLKDAMNDLIFDTERSPQPNRIQNFLHPVNKIHKRVLEVWKNEKVFYSDNETGEIMRNYLMYCKGA